MTAPSVDPALAHHAGDGFDALLPAQMAVRGVEIGVKKSGTGTEATFVLAVLAGAFIALGAAFATTVGAGAMAVTTPDGQVASIALPFGLNRLLVGIAFSLGLILVVVGGAELFTGNVLIVMAWASRRVSTAKLLRNWAIVYVGNLVGALGTTALVVLGGWYRIGSGSVGSAALATASSKVAHTPAEAFFLGILCNILVRLAVWLTYSARSTTDRILAIVPPVAAFVAMGFEHSIANLFFIPVAIAIRAVAPPDFWAATQLEASAFASVDVAGCIANQVPVLLGNLVGGAVFVAAIYWLVFLRGNPEVRAAR
ncbi:MAG: formate/nitrite transporter family protein [Chloroflexota bacterium]